MAAGLPPKQMSGPSLKEATLPLVGKLLSAETNMGVPG